MKTKTFVAFIALAISLLSGTGCSSKQPVPHTQALAATIQVTDFRGKNIELSKPSCRTVCLIESALTGIYMLGAQNSVVGISSNVYAGDVTRQYAALDNRIREKKIPAPGNWDFVSLEGVLALKPDLVIIWASQQEPISAMERNGIPVYGVMLRSFDDVYKEIYDFGKMFGKSNRADSLVAYTQRQLAICSTPVNSERQKVYFMWAQGTLETSGTKSTVNELIQAAGGVNACPDSQEHMVVNIERLIEWNPDVIVMWHNDKMHPSDVLRMNTLKSISAVRFKRVYELPSVFYCDLWTLKFQFAVRLVSSWCYPANGINTDWEKERVEMVRALYGAAAESVPQ